MHDFAYGKKTSIHKDVLYNDNGGIESDYATLMKTSSNSRMTNTWQTGWYYLNDIRLS